MQHGYEHIVDLALAEDIGTGDITSKAIYLNDEQANARLVAKESGIIAGLEIAVYICKQFSDDITFTTTFNDGAIIKKGHTVAQLSGPANLILTAERTMLNFMQRMSGVASYTHLFVEEISHTPVKILDTRKTIPGHRLLDKWAVRLGGGANHRMRLDDLFLIKENHIAVAGSIKKAVQFCVDYKAKNDLSVKIEIEVSSLQELETALNTGNVDIIMLDNMSLTEMQQAVELADGAVKLEASGNISLNNVANVAETGINYISVGAITHSAHALDISLLLDN